MGFFGGGASVANMVGATSSVAGTAGLVPAPAAGKQNSVLMGDATFLNLDDIQMLPDQISDCVLWLRSDDLVTSGSNVTTWNNKVNSNKNAIQTGDATKQPTLVSNQVNGLSAIRFDGTNDCLQISSFSIRPTPTVFIVAKNPNVTTKAFFIEHSDDAGSNDGFYIWGHLNLSIALGMVSRKNSVRVDRYLTSSWSGSDWRINICKFGGAPQNFEAYSAGVYVAPNASFASGPHNQNTATSATLNIGSRNNGSALQSDSDFAEIIIYDRPLWDFEITCISNYLKTRYAL